MVLGERGRSLLRRVPCGLHLRGRLGSRRARVARILHSAVPGKTLEAKAKAAAPSRRSALAWLRLGRRESAAGTLSSRRQRPLRPAGPRCLGTEPPSREGPPKSRVIPHRLLAPRDGGAEEEAEPQSLPGRARRSPAPAAPQQERVLRAAAAHAALATAARPAQADQQGAGARGGLGVGAGGPAAAQLPHRRLRRLRDGRGAAQPPQRLPLRKATSLRQGVLLRAAGARARDAGEAGAAALRPRRLRGGAPRGAEEGGGRQEPGPAAGTPGGAQQLHPEAAPRREPRPRGRRLTPCPPPAAILAAPTASGGGGEGGVVSYGSAHHERDVIRRRPPPLGHGGGAAAAGGARGGAAAAPRGHPSAGLRQGFPAAEALSEPACGVRGAGVADRGRPEPAAVDGTVPAPARLPPRGARAWDTFCSARGCTGA